MEEHAAKFVRMGIRAVTVSGGDPLTIRGLPGFLERLRSLGMEEIKVDTVGTGLLVPGTPGGTWTACERRVDELMSRVDYVGIPLDGWSNETVLTFREGRPKLFDETISLLRAMDRRRKRQVVINTVVHRLNPDSLARIRDEVNRHPCVAHWNVFQYTRTDRVPDAVNDRLAIGEAEFLGATAPIASSKRFNVDIRTVRSRLGQYLLINSDVMCWLPDEAGRTVLLGRLLPGSEEAMLDAWADQVMRMRRRQLPPRERPLTDDLYQLLA
jgi:MoaA/NifB/PqqE/SkfB family radical SAM enzyme